jgi:long-chain fatty acid transport protein
VPGSNRNPAACGDRPGNFFGGCGKLGFDLSQVILAPTLAWTISDRYSFGITPLLAFQQLKAYGLQAFQAISASPNHVTNQGYARSFGAGARVGLFGRVTSWLDVGAAYSTKVYFQDFDEYRGLIADHGSFDIPANFSVGFGFRPGGGVTIGGDVQRIFFNNIPALSNGVSNSVRNPPSDPFGSRNGTGFHWDNVTTYRLALTWTATERLTLRIGGAFGHHPTNGNDANSTSLNLFAPNAKWQGTAGGSWALTKSSEVHVAYGRYMVSDIDGDSATTALGIGGKESIDPHVNTFLIGYSRHIGKK